MSDKAAEDAERICDEMRSAVWAMAATIEAQARELGKQRDVIAEVTQQRDGYVRALKDAYRAPERVSVPYIAKVLTTFYRSELSFSSVCPIMALAEELNPELLVKA